MEQIKKWWRKTTNANIGIPTGEKSGWLALDVDMVVMKPYLHLKQHMENFLIRLLLLPAEEVGTMSLNTHKAGVFQIRPSLHRVLIRVQQVD
ncbi:bifunctional DNA primase/polymerase [Acetivibrio thermocellus]|nr:bifunctional DNA primase/polymerase [Acetivibrio thermocellus]UWV48489.1 bifunctional DNA primase/polymerase [Acetivibrio thermocellus]